MKHALPWIDGYLNILNQFFLSIKNILSDLNFGTLISTMNITCSGSQGPAKVLSNIALGIFTIIILEMFLIEFLNINIKRTMESIRKYLEITYGKFKGGCLGFLLVIGKYFFSFTVCLYWFSVFSWIYNTLFIFYVLFFLITSIYLKNNESIFKCNYIKKLGFSGYSNRGNWKVYLTANSFAVLFRRIFERRWLSFHRGM